MLGQRRGSEPSLTLPPVSLSPYGAPCFIYIPCYFRQYLDFSSSLYVLVERKQSSLSGRAKNRVENIINLPYESKIINHLVTTERLKEYGFLSEAVGSICPHQDFYGGRPIKRKAKEMEEPEAEEEAEVGSDDSDSRGAPDIGNSLLVIH